MRRLVTLDHTAPVIFYVIMTGSIYLLFAGHNQPGGGFVGGLVAGAAISLRYITGGIEEVRHISRLRPWTILGTGLLISASTALVPLMFGDDVLEGAYRSIQVPVVGEVSLVSAMVFDVGVYVGVVGLVFMVFEAFGDRFERDR
jgi:multicomponent Na+:H+ antiporter subunit A